MNDSVGSQFMRKKENLLVCAAKREVQKYHLVGFKPCLKLNNISFNIRPLGSWFKKIGLEVSTIFFYLILIC